MEITVHVSSIFDETQDFRRTGEVLYDKILEGMHAGNLVKLDMSNLPALPSLLLNPSVGRFIDNYGLDKLRKTIAVTNILKSQASLFTSYIKHYEPRR